MRILKGLYLPYEFFIGLVAIATLFVLGFVYSGMFLVAQAALALFLALAILELFILFIKKKLGSLLRQIGDDGHERIYPPKIYDSLV